MERCMARMWRWILTVASALERGLLPPCPSAALSPPPPPLKAPRCAGCRSGGPCAPRLKNVVALATMGGLAGAACAEESGFVVNPDSQPRIRL
jgi:hypothetical protein